MFQVSMEKPTTIGIFVFLIIVIGSLFVLGIFQVNSPTGKVVDTGDNAGVVDNEGDPTGEVVKNCRDVKIPYDVTEEYIEKEPYQGFEDVQVDLKYEHNGYHRESYSELFNVRDKGIVNIKNVDTETGYFSVKMYFTTLGDGTTTEHTGGYVQPSETKEFNIYYDIDSGEDVQWRYEVTPGQKTVTKPVTKYRDITKTRTVTKYRTETKCD